MNSSITKTTDREEWRARILRALAELDSVPPGLDARVPRDEAEADSGTAE